MPGIIAAIDETAANTLFDTALSLIPAQSASGSGSLGPFTASYNAVATFSAGSVDLIPPGTVRISDFRVNWTLSLSFEIDLGKFLPELCLPQVCVDVPCVGEVCTPKICIPWPSIAVPVTLSDFLKVTADFGIAVTQSGGKWKVEIVVQDIPSLQFGGTTAALLAAIAAAVSAVLLPIPFIGPFLALAVDAIIAAIGIGGLTGLLGPMLTPFVSGLRISVYEESVTFVVLPASGPFDPQVTVQIIAVSSDVRGSDKDELVVSVDISG